AAGRSAFGRARAAQLAVRRGLHAVDRVVTALTALLSTPASPAALRRVGSAVFGTHRRPASGDRATPVQQTGSGLARVRHWAGLTPLPGSPNIRQRAPNLGRP